MIAWARHLPGSARVAALLLCGLLAACSAPRSDDASDPVALRDTDVLFEIEGALPDAPGAFAFELDEPRHVTLRSVLAPVRVSWVVRDENGSKVSTRGRPLLAAGRYQVTVTPNDVPPEPLLLKVLTAPRREPEGAGRTAGPGNGSADEALTLRLDAATRLSAAPDQVEHWFRVTSSEEGVLLARLEGATTPVAVELRSADPPTEGVVPAPLASSVDGFTAHAKLPPGEYHVVVRGGGGVNPAPGGVLKVMHRTPEDRPAGGVGIMTIGMDPEQAQRSSLGRIAEATGLPLVSTQTADDILWVLATAIGEELGTDPRWALPCFLIAAGMLLALARQLRRQRIHWTEGVVDTPGGDS